MGTAIKHPVPYWIKPSFVNFVGTLTPTAERQSARVSKITNNGLIQYGTGCFIAVPIWQQWASNGYSDAGLAHCETATNRNLTSHFARQDQRLSLPERLRSRKFLQSRRDFLNHGRLLRDRLNLRHDFLGDEFFDDSG